MIHSEHGRNWLIVEAVSLALILAPAYCLARWTLDNSHLKLRAVLQVALSGLLFLFMLPEIAFALRPISGATSVWQPLIALPHPLLIAALQIIAIAALPGVSAVQEFALRGSGTPIPYDPPQRLVTSGIYRYCASPMQISCGVVLFLWALILRNPWPILAAAIATIYSAGIAHWDEDRDLSARFGSAWQDYRAAVLRGPGWLPFPDALEWSRRGLRVVRRRATMLPHRSDRQQPSLRVPFAACVTIPPTARHPKKVSLP